MLAAVETQNDRYEGLRDYILSNKRPPPFVSAPNSRPRLENEPGNPIPGVQGKIPTSSQRPGKRTNETIPYGRMVFTEFHGSPADPSDMFPGDVMMVHNSSSALGNDTNRATMCATWRQVNAILDRAVVGQTALGRGMKPLILESRKNILDVLEKQSEHERAELDFLISLKRDQGPDFDRIVGAKLAIDALVANVSTEISRLETNDPGTTFDPFTDIFSLPFFKTWSPDGLLMSRDDDEQNASYFHAGGGDSGVMLNIAVQGPAYARNTSAQDYTYQVFDPEARIRDSLFLLVVAKKNTDDAGNFKSISFQLRPTSSRIIEELVRRGAATPYPTTGYPIEKCISWVDLTSAVFGWKVGSVMDNAAATHPENKFQINVSISSMTIFDLREMFGNEVGSNVNVSPVPVFP